ncbi:hypothetical protein COH20_010119 [Aspergillus flavus]|nr:hypothetical protein COH20_010119 [Aspergillus flavus]
MQTGTNATQLITPCRGPSVFYRDKKDSLAALRTELQLDISPLRPENFPLLPTHSFTLSSPNRPLISASRWPSCEIWTYSAKGAWSYPLSPRTPFDFAITMDTLEFASVCRPGVPLDGIDICGYSSITTEIVRTQPEEGFASNWRYVMCQDHWTIVFRYGGKQATATKHRGYDLKWILGDWGDDPPSTVLKFEALSSCPPMDDIAWRLYAIEYPGTRVLGCSEFVYYFMKEYAKHLSGPRDELREHLRMSH